MKRLSAWPLAAIALTALVVLTTVPARASDALLWRKQQDKVDADFNSWSLTKLLTKVSAAAGYTIRVEPGISYVSSTKFRNLTQDQALKRLLGDLNYRKTVSNGVTEISVYKTTARAATELVKSAPAQPRKDYRIQNEWIVRLKKGSGTSPEQLANSVGAKIVGRDDKLGLYRLQFADATAASGALDSLEGNSAVASVDSNYIVDRPSPSTMTPVTGAAAPSFNLNPQIPANGPIVGLIDTAIQAQDQFKNYLLPPQSVVGTPDPSSTEPTHGTSMLETLVAAMGNSPSKILPVDIYGSGESTTTFEVAQGLVNAVNSGANPINMSLGGTGDSSLLENLISQAAQKGIQIVAASGNNGGVAETFPAAYPGVLSVTASAPNGQVASYADDGPWVKVIAPGTAPVVLNGQEWIVDGTSVSTAIVTGTIAQLENSQHLSLSQAVNAVLKMSPAPKP
jgi:hypothetical protein